MRGKIEPKPGPDVPQDTGQGQNEWGQAPTWGYHFMPRYNQIGMKMSGNGGSLNNVVMVFYFHFVEVVWVFCGALGWILDNLLPESELVGRAISSLKK